MYIYYRYFHNISADFYGSIERVCFFFHSGYDLSHPQKHVLLSYKFIKCYEHCLSIFQMKKVFWAWLVEGSKIVHDIRTVIRHCNTQKTEQILSRYSILFEVQYGLGRESYIF